MTWPSANSFWLNFLDTTSGLTRHLSLSIEKFLTFSQSRKYLREIKDILIWVNKLK